MYPILSLLHAFSHNLIRFVAKKHFVAWIITKNRLAQLIDHATNDNRKLIIKAERQKRLDEIEKYQTERMKKRQYLRKMATQQFYKSMQMLQANAKREKDEPFEDYSIFLYRQTAPDFKDRVKDLEQKILYPVSQSLSDECKYLIMFFFLCADEKPVSLMFEITA